MKKLETREQAEARALELYPDKPCIITEWGKLDVSEHERQAFLQCWKEMQKVNQKELLCEMMRKDEESGLYEHLYTETEKQTFINKISAGQNFFEAIERTTDFTPLLDDMDEIINALIEDNLWLIVELKEKHNQLLTVKQAESICIGFYNELVSHLESGLSTELFHSEIVFNKQLEKALK